MIRVIGAIVLLAVLFGLGYGLAVITQVPAHEVVIREPIKVAIPEFQDRLDAFRSDWEIGDRFERWPTALPLAILSKAVYEPLDKTKFGEEGLKELIPISNQFHTQFAYVAYGADVAVIVFRGTDDTEDWILNANRYVRSGDKGGMHAGFASAYAMLRQEIVKAVADIKPKHLWITGHSLGGALALLCAYDLERNYDLQVKGVITYGQPRLARNDFSKHLQEEFGDRYARFVNGADAVPRLPDSSFPHCGCLVWFDGEVIKRSVDYPLDERKASPSELIDVHYVKEDVVLPGLSANETEQFRQDVMMLDPVRYKDQLSLRSISDLGLEETRFTKIDTKSDPSLKGFELSQSLGNDELKTLFKEKFEQFNPIGLRAMELDPKRLQDFIPNIDLKFREPKSPPINPNDIRQRLEDINPQDLERGNIVPSDGFGRWDSFPALPTSLLMYFPPQPSADVPSDLSPKYERLFSWKSDHGMQNYIDKIETAIEDARK